MDRDDVRPSQEFIERDEIDSVVLRRLGRDVGVRGEDRHLHRTRPGRDRLADLAKPDDPEGSAAQLEAGEQRPIPLAATDGGIGGRNLPGDAVKERKGVLRCRDRVAGRGIDDRDAGPRGRLQVDVVDADPGPPDHLEAGPGGDDAGIHLDLAADDERVVVPEGRAQLCGRQARPLVDLVMGAEEGHALGRDRFRDEDPHAGTPAPLVDAWLDSPRASAAAA